MYKKFSALGLAPALTENFRLGQQSVFAKITWHENFLVAFSFGATTFDRTTITFFTLEHVVLLKLVAPCMNAPALMPNLNCPILSPYLSVVFHCPFPSEVVNFHPSQLFFSLSQK
jgi:hypothetical protein